MQSEFVVGIEFVIEVHARVIDDFGGMGCEAQTGDGFTQILYFTGTRHQHHQFGIATQTVFQQVRQGALAIWHVHLHCTVLVVVVVLFPLRTSTKRHHISHTLTARQPFALRHH